MKIFVGGMKPMQIPGFAEKHPGAEFVFVTEDAPVGEWVRQAHKADKHLVFQHRTTHTIVERLQAQGCKPLFTDSVPIMHQLIEDIITHGEARHYYNGTG